MTSRIVEVIYGGAVLAAALLAYWLGGGGGDMQSPRIADDPFWYPKILLILMMVCAGAVLLRAVVGRLAEGLPDVRWSRLGGTVLLSAVFLLVYQRIGFVFDALIMIPVMAWFLGFRRPVLLVIVSLMFALVVWYGFHFLLNITPPGPGLPTFGS